MSATLDWVIVRDGPGTWACNADWDEYLLSVANLTGMPPTIKSVAVLDSLGTRIDSQSRRKRTVAGSKQTARRDKGAGVKARAGAGRVKLTYSEAAGDHLLTVDTSNVRQGLHVNGS